MAIKLVTVLVHKSEHAQLCLNQSNSNWIIIQDHDWDRRNRAMTVWLSISGDKRTVYAGMNVEWRLVNNNKIIPRASRHWKGRKKDESKKIAKLGETAMRLEGRVALSDHESNFST